MAYEIPSVILTFHANQLWLNQQFKLMPVVVYINNAFVTAFIQVLILP